ncbi:sedoheptulose 7-phosphate cyclase [Kineococcus xinjiangensis]|uniref:sedoheptulose 7-phosphate cyclase n=1 Tax=Kineococcus xinjiangensis TaxID=512762 RepID=UPI001FE63319|nr:sedoheptulose 7-phosphate cyclase [Kineococcus xinjiangensis]
MTDSTSGLVVRSSRVDTWRVHATQEVAYEIRQCDDVFDPDSTDLVHAARGAGSRRRFVVIDSRVNELYGARMVEYFDHHGVEARILPLEVDETVKNLDTVTRIVREIDAFGIDRRREPIIVIGGGVIMDVVGLAANLYRRGTPFVRVPTTLIGLVDAGVGVKTGVNFNSHKNRLGTYFDKSLTLLDTGFLASLDRRHLSNGLGEILKIALIKDRELFVLLDRFGADLLRERFQNSDRLGRRAAASTLQRAIQGMLEELQPNLWEANLERLVDYGHTFSPTIEMRALPELLHGEAVAVDMAITTMIATHRGLMSAAESASVLNVMAKLGLPTWDDSLDADLLARALEETVRHRDGQQRLPLPVGIGAATFVNDVTHQELDAALSSLHSASYSKELQTA